MALVCEIKKQELERDVKHNEVDCTYTIIENDEGKFLQIDTYGSTSREFKGKKSQSIRFNQKAIEQLKNLLQQF